MSSTHSYRSQFTVTSANNAVCVHLEFTAILIYFVSVPSFNAS